MQIFDNKQIDLDLNGPILSWTTNPTGVTGIGTTVGSTSGGGSVSLTGIAASSFQGNVDADKEGSIAYQWYEQGIGALSDSTYVTGTATTTLTLTNLITPTDNQRKFYLEADYVPPYTGTTATYTTGNAPNEPFNSGVGTVTVDPLIEIIAQPTTQTTLINSTTGTYDTGKFVSFIINANLSDSYFGDDLTYQWFIDGEEATDGVRTKTTTTTVENTYTSTTGPIIVPSSATDIEVVVAGAKGGTGGFDAGGPGGRGAQGRAGRFTMTNGSKDLHFYIGNQGNSGSSGQQNAFGAAGLNPGTADGGNGGGAGGVGWSGGGGGGGAGTYLNNNGSAIVVAGGGGGGGGGSLNRAGGTKWNTNSGTGKEFGEGNLSNIVDGDAGQSTNPNQDGGGGGGGGGGAQVPSGGEGGGHGRDNGESSRAGTGGGSAWNATILTREGSEWLNDGNGYGYLKYTGIDNNRSRKTSLSGSTTSTLKVACDTVGIQTAQCKISSVTASNSYLMTDEVTAVFVSSAAANEIKIEAIGNTATASLSDIDLNNGEYTFNVEGTDADNNGLNQFYILYSPNKDIDVEMDLYGGQGLGGGGNNGGEGGYSRIRFTLEQNQEYVIAGLVSSVNAPFLYRRGILMACVGKGGDMTQSGSGNGGAGGGVNISGASGTGNNSGSGGSVITAGSVNSNGVFGSSYTAPIVYPGDTQATGNNGGQTIKCTKGIYWRQQGIGACNDIGTGKFRLSDGTIVTNTVSGISRGFKAGYNIMQTGGSSTTTVGGQGGNGATGGDGSDGNGGGGGGSGYHDGTVTVVSTQLGGSTNDAKVILRLQS